MRIRIFIGAMLFFVPLLTAQEFQINGFEEYLRLVNELEQSGNYNQARLLTKQVWQDFPEQKFELYKEMAYLNEKTGNLDANLELWRLGHADGYFFLLDKRMPKYKAYLKKPEFEILARDDSRLRKMAMQKNRTRAVVELPPGFDNSRSWPLLFILHGGGRNLQTVKRDWKRVPVMDQFITVYLQSYRSIDWNTFGWTSGDQRAHREIRAIYDSLSTIYTTDRNGTVLAGMSAGATMALDIVWRGILPAAGIIAFCPGLPHHIPDTLPFPESARVFMIGGETDYYRPKQELLQQRFERQGIVHRYRVLAGLGHRFPEKKYETLLEQGLQFVLFPGGS